MSSQGAPGETGFRGDVTTSTPHHNQPAISGNAHYTVGGCANHTLVSEFVEPFEATYAVEQNTDVHRIGFIVGINQISAFYGNASMFQMYKMLKVEWTLTPVCMYMQRPDISDTAVFEPIMNMAVAWFPFDRDASTTVGAIPVVLPEMPENYPGTKFKYYISEPIEGLSPIVVDNLDGTATNDNAYWKFSNRDYGSFTFGSDRLSYRQNATSTDKQQYNNAPLQLIRSNGIDSTPWYAGNFYIYNRARTIVAEQAVRRFRFAGCVKITVEFSGLRFSNRILSDFLPPLQNGEEPADRDQHPDIYGPLQEGLTRPRRSLPGAALVSHDLEGPSRKRKAVAMPTIIDDQ